LKQDLSESITWSPKLDLAKNLKILENFQVKQSVELVAKKCNYIDCKFIILVKT